MRMRGWRSWLAVDLYGVALASLAASMVSLAIPSPASQEHLADVVGILFAFATYATVGVLLLVRRPENRVGWLVGAVGFFPLLGGAADVYAERAADWPLSDTALWFTGWYFIAATGTLPLLFLLFPDGRPAGRRWRWPVIVAAAGLAALLVRYMAGPADATDVAVVNPYQLAAVDPFIGTLSAVGTGGLLLGVVAGGASLLWRFRRARGVERQQVKWFATAVVLDLLLLALAAAVSEVWPKAYWALNWSFVVMLVLPAAAIVVAVLRYRLYDIDRLVSRTVSYLALTAVIAVPYALVVTGASRVFASSNQLVVAIATLVAAAVFNPLRRGIQRRVDRRFNRNRYDADRTVEEFSRRLRAEVDLEAVRRDLVAVIDQTLQPAQAALWLRPGRHGP